MHKRALCRQLRFLGRSNRDSRLLLPKMQRLPEKTDVDAVASPLAVQPQRTLLDAILESIMTPGASSGLIATINGALLLLLLTLIVLAVTQGPDVHTLVLMFFAVGLLGSLNYYIAQVRSGESEATESDSQTGSAAAASSGSERRNKND